MLGMGEKYGIFIHPELIKGKSNECLTFDNPVLAGDNDFEI